MADETATLWQFFVGVLLTIGILIAAVVGSMLLGRRRLADSHLQYARRLLVVRDEERALLAGEIHSEMAQRIAALRVELSEWGDNPPSARISSVTKELDDLGEALRNLAHRLHPRVVDRHGLGVALTGLRRELKDPIGFDLDLQLSGEPMPKGDTGHHLFRIVQEALNNVRRHAGVNTAEVRVDVDSDIVRVEIEDTGLGFDPSTDAGKGLNGLGLRSIHERAALIGARCDVRSSPGSGTLVRVSMPLTGHANAKAETQAKA